eukprot:TRINITY_DN7354_c0_g1_i3.p3 TRINITY_DN7354_c0_g1~~TRINITY_DN7354_c0_g1_i3.p3  ORF type:complete len:126 (+),score=11.07 TRINITY_DN7354_c0_g1_i3:1017-1394(+)
MGRCWNSSRCHVRTAVSAVVDHKSMKSAPEDCAGLAGRMRPVPDAAVMEARTAWLAFSYASSALCTAVLYVSTTSSPAAAPALAAPAPAPSFPSLLARSLASAASISASGRVLRNRGTACAKECI